MLRFASSCVRVLSALIGLNYPDHPHLCPCTRYALVQRLHLSSGLATLPELCCRSACS